MTTYFTRDGVPASGQIYAGARGKYKLATAFCSRCGGQGGAEQWRHTGYTCYQCGGNGGKHTVKIPVYTAEEIATLDARQAAKKAKADEKKAAIAAERAASFDATYPEIATRFAKLVKPSAFLASVIEKGRTYGVLTDRQIEAVNKALDKEIAQQAAPKAVEQVSQYVGEVGQRIDITARIMFVVQFDSAFGVTTVTGLKDEAGNVYIQKGVGLGGKGETITLKATVKAHNERDGVRQTIITRPKVVP